MSTIGGKQKLALPVRTCGVLKKFNVMGERRERCWDVGDQRWWRPYGRTKRKRRAGPGAFNHL